MKNQSTIYIKLYKNAFELDSKGRAPVDDGDEESGEIGDDQGDESDSSAAIQLPEHHYNMSPSAIVSLLLLNLAPSAIVSPTSS